jgi:hypothetical protein
MSGSVFYFPGSIYLDFSIFYPYITISSGSCQ